MDTFGPPALAYSVVTFPSGPLPVISICPACSRSMTVFSGMFSWIAAPLGLTGRSGSSSWSSVVSRNTAAPFFRSGGRPRASRTSETL